MLNSTQVDAHFLTFVIEGIRQLNSYKQVLDILSESTKKEIEMLTQFIDAEVPLTMEKANNRGNLLNRL